MAALTINNFWTEAQQYNIWLVGSPKTEQGYTYHVNYQKHIFLQYIHTWAQVAYFISLFWKSN